MVLYTHINCEREFIYKNIWINFYYLMLDWTLKEKQQLNVKHTCELHQYCLKSILVKKVQSCSRDKSCLL